LKNTNIDGTLNLTSDFLQSGGSSSLKNLRVNNITMNTNKSINQVGTTSNKFGHTTISDLIVINSLILPSDIEISGALYTEDITTNSNASIIQDLTGIESNTSYFTNIF